MTAMNLSLLATYTTLTFDEFKTLNDLGQNRANLYHTLLKQEATNAGLTNVQNYAELARHVVRNDDLNGKIV